MTLTYRINIIFTEENGSLRGITCVCQVHAINKNNRTNILVSLLSHDIDAASHFPFCTTAKMKISFLIIFLCSRDKY